jgi:hypothetical protein
MAKTKKTDRLKVMIERLGAAQPTTTGLLAYKLVSELLNEIEDEALGSEHWSPPRTFHGGALSERLYPTYPESMHAVDGWPGVTLLVHSKQLVFISLCGAIQIQAKDDDCKLPYNERSHLVLLEKADAYGKLVWNTEHA